MCQTLYDLRTEAQKRCFKTPSGLAKSRRYWKDIRYCYRVIEIAAKKNPYRHRLQQQFPWRMIFESLQLRSPGFASVHGDFERKFHELRQTKPRRRKKKSR